MGTRTPCRTRRSFLADTGMGFTGLARAPCCSGRHRAGRDPSRPRVMPQAKAKSVIWIFLCGGVSHVESFDPKPELNR